MSDGYTPRQREYIEARALAATYPDDDALRIIGELERELAEGDSWVERCKEHVANGCCPYCFASDETGHEDGCLMGDMEEAVRSVHAFIELTGGRCWTPEGAKQVVSACASHVWAQQAGLASGAAKSIDEFSLGELLCANRVIADSPGERIPGGGTRHYVHCDDRLVAALYVAAHWPASDPAHAQPVAVVGDKAVLVVTVPADTKSEER